MITTDNRRIREAAHNDYSRWKQRLDEAFVVANLGVSAGAETITFDDPTVTTEDHFGRSVEIHGNHIAPPTIVVDEIAATIIYAATLARQELVRRAF